MKKIICIVTTLVFVVLSFAACAEKPEFTTIEASDIATVYLTEIGNNTEIDTAAFVEAYNKTTAESSEFVSTSDLLGGDETMFLVIREDKTTFPVYVLEGDTILIGEASKDSTSVDRYYTATNADLAALCEELAN